MEVLMSDLVKEMRIAMDEVLHDEVNDIITDDSDTEMKQAIETSCCTFFCLVEDFLVYSG